MAHTLRWITVVALVLPAIAWGKPLTIQVQDEALVQGPDITLEDVANIQGGTSDTAAKARGIVIGQSPPAGEIRILHGRYVAARLKQHGLSSRDMQISTPEKIRVTRASQQVTSGEIEAEVRRAVTTQMPWTSEQARMRAIRGIEAVRLPAGPVQTEVTFPAKTNFIGPTSFNVTFRVDGNVEKRLYGTVDIDVTQQVVTTARPIPRHAVITADDLRLRRVNMSRTPRRILTDLDDVVGKRAKRSLAANATLHAHEVERMPVVRKGDAVLLIVESPVLKITTMGEALEAGQRGATIRVRNTTSKREVRAVVVDKKTVRIPF